MHIIIPLLISSIAGISTILGFFLVFLKINPNNLNKFITFCLAFSISIMICISIFDLIPESFFQIVCYYSISRAITFLVFSIILSIIVLRILKLFLNKSKDNLYCLGILNMIVLIFHNLPEGIATFVSSYHDINLGLKLGLAIMLHNIPEGISIAIPIFYSTKSKIKAFRATLISGLSEPLGALLAFIFFKNYVNDLMISFILIIVAGIMITLSIQEMLPASLKYNENKYIYLGFFIGLLLFGLNFLLAL
ncbi:zinc transporter ZupT [bacterium]|nr:zinc transporter ZupT [bacterium]MBD8923329.1 zinc transporter ZupT [bacterium]